MQSVVGFPTDLTSAEPSMIVRVAGVAVTAESLSVKSTLESAMPSNVAAAGGAVVAATGDATILPGSESVLAPVGPWGVGAPTQGAGVTVEAGYNGKMARIFTGSVDGFSGAPSMPGIDTGLIDAVDKLDRPITMEPILNVAPSLTEGDWTFRRAGLQPTYVTDRLLRHCGFNATPMLSGKVVFAAPMMGSTWPEVGTLTAASAASLPDASAAFRRTPWGLGLGNAKLKYTPTLSGLTGKFDGPFQMVFCRTPHTLITGSATWDIKWGNDGMRVWLPSNGNINALFITNGVESGRVSMTSTAAGNADTFTVRWLTSGNVTIYASNGATATATVPIPASLTTTAMTGVEINQSPETYIWGGMQASFSTYPAHEVPRTAVLSAPALLYSLDAFPAVRDRSCADLLTEQATAELAAMWIDEYGVFRWVNREQLTSAPSSGTLTALDNLLDLPWEVPTKSTFSKVTVESSEATVIRRSKTNLKVWQGSSGSMENLDSNMETIAPPTEKDWHQVGTPVRASTATVNDIRYGRGSYMGGIIIRDGVENRWATALELKQVFTRVAGGQYKITSSAEPAVATDLIEQRIFGVQYGSYHNEDLPILRAKAETTWDTKTTTGVSVGPSNAPELSHPVGPWIQDAVELQSFANWLADHVTVSSPIIRDVPIVPDPRIQKGDVFWLEDPSVYRVRLKVLVMGLDLAISAGPPVVMTQSITCRVISVERPWATLAEHDAVWADTTLSVHDAYWAAYTLAQQDAEPLKRG